MKDRHELIKDARFYAWEAERERERLSDLTRRGFEPYPSDYERVERSERSLRWALEDLKTED